MSDIYNEANLRKNKVTRTEVDQVMRSHLSVWFSLKRSDRGNERAMVVGFTLTGRMLEIGVEVLNDAEDTLWYFHFMDATKPYRKKFEELRK